MIQIKHVSKDYPSGVTALEDVSLHVAKDEFVYLIGPSGVGKSTLLKLIFMAEEPSAGKITVGRYVLSRVPKKQIPFLRRNIGMIFQDYKLLPKRTVYENVSFALRVMHVAPKRIRRLVFHALELVGLETKLDFLPGQLSGGEQQRICIARAIVNNPPILLCDEPTGNLDPDTSWEIVQLLNKINTRQTTVIMATHDTEIVDSIPKRVVAMESGKIVRDQDLGGYID